MGFNEFWLNLNGKKQQIGDVKHGVRKEQVDQKFHNLFDAYDVNQDGTLEEEELTGIFKGLSKFAGADKVLDAKENAQVKSVFSQQVNIQDADFQGFVKSISDASADIKSTKTTATPDGGKEVRTEYADGTVETISYYPDGEYKFKKVDAKTVSTSYYYIVGNNLDKRYTAQQVEDVVKDAYKHENHARTTRSGEKTTEIARFSYKDFKKVYMSRNNIKKLMATSESERHDLELSERAKQDVAVRDFVLSHYIETHQAAKEALESMGILDNAGALINAGAGEAWNAIKNKWNGTEEEYQNFYELKDKFAPNNKKLETLQQTQGFVQRNQDEYFKSYETSFQENFGQKYDLEISTKFQAKAEQYQNAQILKERLNLLKTAMNEVEQYDIEKNSNLLMPGDVNTASSHITKANELLLQYFGGDQNAVNMILNGAMGDENAKVVQAIKDIYTETQKMNEAVLGGKSFDEIQDEYKTQYKEMYNTDFVPDELTEKVMDAKATGSFVKLAAITIVSILVTRSPIMAEISGAAAGSAEATGAAANMIRNLLPIVTRQLGSETAARMAIQQGIKFAMTSGTLATDVGLTLLNQVTSERGVNGEELWESTKSSAKYIYFGAYIGAPVAEAVGNAVGKIGLAKGLMSGGATTTQGAIKTTTLTGDKVFENILNTGKNVGQKLAVGSAKIGTDIAMFSALGIATDGQEVGEAFAEQSTFLPKLKIMNHVLEYALGRMMGGKAGAINHTNFIDRPIDLKMEEAFKRSGVKNWVIKEIKSPTGTRINVIDENGIPQTYSDRGQLATAMLERVAKTYEEVKIDTPETQVKEDASIRTPQGKINDIQDAIKTNPAENAERKVLSEVAKTEFKDEGMRLNTPESLDVELADIERNPNAPVENLETLSLVINGKLGETLKTQYEKAGKVFEEIITKNADKISKLEEQYKDNKPQLAKEFTQLIANELGVKGIEPQIEFVDFKQSDAAGYFDWTSGKLLINKELSSPKDIETIIAHEFVHVMQFKDMVAARGEDAIREIYTKQKDGKFLENKTREYLEEEGLDYDTETPEDQEFFKNQILDALVERTMEANEGLIRFAQEHPIEKGSLNEYLTRIYLDENNNMAEFDTPEYYNQVIENEAYFLGNGKIGDKIKIDTKIAKNDVINSEYLIDKYSKVFPNEYKNDKGGGIDTAIDNLIGLYNLEDYEPKIRSTIEKLMNYKLELYQQDLCYEKLDIEEIVYCLIGIEDNINNINNICEIISSLVDYKTNAQKLNEFIEFLYNNTSNPHLKEFVNRSKIIKDVIPTFTRLTDINEKQGMNMHARPLSICLMELYGNIDEKYIPFLINNPEFTNRFARWGIIFNDNKIMDVLINEYKKNSVLDDNIISALNMYKETEKMQDLTPKLAEDLHKFMQTQETQIDMIVHRGDGEGFAKSVEISGTGKTLYDILLEHENDTQDQLDYLVADKLSGQKIINKNFISTSFNTEIANHFASQSNDIQIVWELNIPKGTHGCVIDLLSDVYPYESEFLLQNESKYVIQKIENNNGIWYIKANIIQE